MERSPELEKLVVSWFDAATRGDLSLVDRHVSRDEGTLLVGSDPNEWFPGKTAAEFLRTEVRRSGGSVRSLTVWRASRPAWPRPRLRARG
jgi:hypothetical protein